MFKVTVRGPDGSETHYPLGPDQGLIIGRDDASDVVLPSKRVSRRHARIFTREGKLNIEDLGSQNGVFVGGARVNGTAEIRPGHSIEIGEFNLRVRRDDLTSAENSYAGILQGFGATEGRTLNLPKERGVVGREESADIVILADSVSRRHAELRFAGLQGYYVQDLGSANGTFLNGVRLPPRVERPLRPSDRIQFGDTPWLVVPRSAVPVSVTERSRRRVLIGLILFLVAIAGIVFFLEAHPLQFGQRSPVTTPFVIRASAIDFCNEAISEARWPEAQKSCAEAYDEEPFLDRRQLLRKAEREVKYKQVFDEANRLASVGSDREAIERFFGIDPSSSYFPQARLAVQQLAKEVMRRDEMDCRQAARRHDKDAVITTCGRYLRYQCSNGPNADILKLLRGAEKSRSGEPWKCPPQLAVWFSSALSTTVDRSAYCRGNYPTKELCDAIVDYAHEQADDALRILAKIQSKLDSAKYGALPDEIKRVDGRYKEGQSALATNDFVSAETAYSDALASDTKIMLDGHESDYAKSMRDALAQHYLKLGDTAKGSGDLHSAFGYYVKAAGYRQNSELNQLEDQARELLQREPNCDNARSVLGYTRPTSDPYQKARTIMASCGG